MADKPFDPYLFTEGFVTSVDNGPVEDAWFTFDADYKEDVCVLKLRVNTNDPEVGDNGVIENIYPCSSTDKGWTPGDKNGTTVVHEAGNKNFNANSGVALLWRNAVEAGAGETLRERGTPFDAHIWKELIFDWERKKVGTFEGRDYQRFLPTKFLGIRGHGPRREKLEAVSSNGEVDDLTMAKIKAIAKSSDSQIKFVERVFDEVDGALGNSAIEALVMDKSDTGVYATNHG